MILGIAILIFLVVAVLLFMMDAVQSIGEENIIPDKTIPKDINVILVLGAGIGVDGKPCDMLIDRLETAINISRKINNVKFLLSGDHKSVDYNEVGTMKEYLMKSIFYISEESIFLDHSGFCTYDSIYRAKEVFNVSKMIVITNEYHLPRALYLAKKMGIEAYGIKSDMRDYSNIEIYKEREILAQIKDFIYVNFFKSKRKLGDKKVSIEEESGKITEYLWKRK